MFFTILVVSVLAFPLSWTSDTNLTAWCQQENITPAQIMDEFAVLDSILAVEQRQAWSTASGDDTVYHSHSSLANLGMTVSEFNSIHSVRLPHTPITTNPDCRVYFSRRTHSQDLDTCPTLNVSVYVVTRMTDMPMVNARRCLTNGQTIYEFQTETGTLEYNQTSQCVELLTYGSAAKQRFILWSAYPLNASDTIPAKPSDSICLPTNKASCEPH